MLDANFGLNVHNALSFRDFLSWAYEHLEKLGIQWTDPRSLVGTTDISSIHLRKNISYDPENIHAEDDGWVYYRYSIEVVYVKENEIADDIMFKQADLAKGILAEVRREGWLAQIWDTDIQKYL